MKYKIINRNKLYITIFIDTICKIVFLPLKIFRSNSLIDSHIKEVLIIRTAYIGDVLMTLPILKPLKEKFPKARISFMTSKDSGELLKGNPYIDKIFYFNPFWFYKSSVLEYLKFIRKIRKEKYDLVIETRGDIREILFIVSLLKSRFKMSYGFGGGTCLLTHVVPFDEVKHRIEYHLDLVRYLGCFINKIDWGIYLQDDEKLKIKEILEINGIKRPYILIHPGARLPLKRWSIVKYASLCNLLIEKYRMDVILLDSKQEIEPLDNNFQNMKCKPVSYVGKLSLRELAGLISDAEVFVCNDSAPMHIAAAMGTPTVAIFGPSKSIETGPYGKNHVIVEKEFACRPTCDESRCKNKDRHACMESISLEDVLGAVEQHMGRIKKMATKNDLKKQDSASQIRCSI